MKKLRPGVMRIAVIAGIAGSLGACSLAPHYVRPPVPPPPPRFQGSAQWRPAVPAAAQDRGHWWRVFGDPQLDALEARVTNSNQDLKAALARLEQARAQTRIARAAYFPTLTANPSATRAQTSVNSPDYTNTRPRTYNDFLLGADLSYEIDVWGRVRNTVAAARASAQASADDLATLDLSTHAELATDYFMLRSQDAQQLLLDRTVADYRRALALNQSLYEGGAGLLSDVDQSKAQLESALTQAQDMRLSRAQTAHALAVLLGESASTYLIAPRALPAYTLPPPVDPGLPSTLLQRRPDVAAAERRVAAANAQIGVARAAYFPVFSLNGSVGFESVATSNLISAPSRFWSIGPGAALTLFDGGLHRAQNAQARAAYDEQVADYRGAVLTAFQEVEDALSALHDLELESTSAAAAVTASTQALDLAQYRFEGGATTYLEVVVAENTALSARLAAANIQLRRLGASVMLIKALGGTWP